MAAGAGGSHSAGSAGTRGVRDTHQAIQIEGLARFRRELAKIDKDLSKEISKYLRALGKELRDEARRRTPVAGGDLRKSIKHSVTAKSMSLYSNLPYAAAQEWGTSGRSTSRVKPRGVPIKIKRSQMLGHTVFSNAKHIEEHVLGLIDHLARTNGFDD